MPPTCARERFATAGEKNTAVAWTLPWRSGAPVAGKAGDRASARAGAGGEVQRAVAQNEEPEGEDPEQPVAPQKGGVELRQRGSGHPKGCGRSDRQIDNCRRSGRYTGEAGTHEGSPGETSPGATS